MKTLYITEHGLQLKKRSNLIAVKRDGKIIKEIRTMDLKRILIFGNCQVTTSLMKFLSDKGVEVAFLSSHGKFQYRLVPKLTKNIFLRMAHHDRYRDMDFRMRFSKEIVRAKIKNQRIFLIRYRRVQSRVELTRAIESLKKSLNRIDETKNLKTTHGSRREREHSLFQSLR